MKTKVNMAPDANLSVFERVSYGLGNFGNALLFTIVSAYMVYYYTNVVGLNAGVISTILLASKVFDGVTDLIMGRIVDRTHSKWGKARVWILLMAVPYALSAVLLFAVPIHAAKTYQYIFVFIMYNLVCSIFYTAITVPYNSLGVLITTNAYERGVLGALLMIFSCGASVFLNIFILKWVAMFGGTPSAWTKTLAVFAAIGLAAHLACYFGTHERVGETETADASQKHESMKEGVGSLLRNKYWLMFLLVNLLLWSMIQLNAGATIYYAESVLNDVNIAGTLNNIGLVPQIVCTMLAVALIKKFGKGKTFLVGAVFILVGFVLMLLCPRNATMLMLGLALKGCGSGFSGGCALGITADTIDYGYYKTKIRVTGMGTAAMTFSQKVASGLGGAVLGWVITLGGYDANAAEQSASAMMSLKLSFIIIPLILTLGIAVVMFFFDLDKQLENYRRGAQAEEN